MKRGALFLGMGLGLSALLAGCGGGGGSGGESAQEYKITLSAEKQRLPVNIASYPPGIGVNAPYTTTLYVNATAGGAPIPGGTEVFACNLESGVSVGSLVYLDGDHLDDDDNELLFRSVTLGANSGGNSFHFHAGNQAGTARITCSVTDPRDSKVKTASVDIVVGNTQAPAAGMPAALNILSKAPAYLGTTGNLNGVSNSIAVQAKLVDETNQPVADTATANLYAYIQGGTGSEGAILRSGKQSGTAIMSNSLNGIADFRVYGGSKVGSIVLVLVADRADNNVANGIQDPITQRLVIPVWNGVPTETLTLASQTVTATCNQRVSYALTASGGTPPYTWSASGDLPDGLSLTSDGLVTGVPSSLNGTNTGSFQVPVTVTDSNGTSVSANMTITVDAGTCTALAINESSVAATTGESFVYALSASGGTAPYTWQVLAGSGVSIGASTGILTGSYSTAGTRTVVVRATDADGVTTQANITIVVSDPS